GRQGQPAASEALPNTNWFDPDFDSGELGPRPAALDPPPQDPPASAAAPHAPHEAAPAAEPTLAPAIEAEPEPTAPTVPLDRHIELRTPLVEPPPAPEPRALDGFTAEIAAALTSPD